MRKSITELLNGGYRLLGIVALLALWEGLSFLFPPVIVPSVEGIFSALGRLVLESSFWGHLYHTIVRALVGFGLSLAIGGVLGVLAGLNRRVYDLIGPVIVVVENVPPIVWVIVAIIWFGLGDVPPVFAIMSVGIPIIAVNVAQGIRGLDPSLLEMARAFEVKRGTRLRDLYLPAITGYLFSAVSVGHGLTWRVVVMAEFFGSMSGIGNELNWARFNLETDKAFAYTLVVVILGLGTEYLVVNPLKEWALRWQRT